jgi:hypothetical protein
VGGKVVARQRRTGHNIVKQPTDGWLVKTPQGYYTGHPRSALESWTAFPKLAKVYKRQRWAAKMAARLGGQAVPLTAAGNGRTTSP